MPTENPLLERIKPLGQACTSLSQNQQKAIKNLETAIEELRSSAETTNTSQSWYLLSIQLITKYTLQTPNPNHLEYLKYCIYKTFETGAQQYTTKIIDLTKKLYENNQLLLADILDAELTKAKERGYISNPR